MWEGGVEGGVGESLERRRTNEIEIEGVRWRASRGSSSGCGGDGRSGEYIGRSEHKYFSDMC